MDYRGRPDEGEYAEFYRGYVGRVGEGGLVELLAREAGGMRALVGGLSDEGAAHAYAPGKWTVRQVVGHVTDAERVFGYRALRIARGDTTPLSGFDENAYVPAGEFDSRLLAGLLDEFEAVRRSTIALFAGLPEAAWTRRGMASGQTVSVRALGCIAIGHELHHRAILQDRYDIRTRPTLVPDSEL